MAVEDSLDIFGADPFGRDVMYGLSTGQEPLGLAPPPQGLPVDTRPYDRMQATPRGFISGLFSDVLGRTFDMPALPRTGIPSIDLFAPNMNAFNRLALGDVQKTAERISYGEPLTTGAGMTLRPRDETIGAAMTVAPFAPVAGRVAGRTGRAVGRMAGEEINAAITGQPTRSLLGAITPKPKLLDVYHGTPHTLPPTERNPLGEFDASKIGSGEGAQAYGYGIYSAENPAVAKEYQFMQQNWFDTSKAKYKGKSIDTWYEQAQKDQERAFRTKNKALEQDATARLAYWENIMTHNHPENVLKQFTDPNYGWDAATNYAKSIDLGKFEGIPRTGNLYKVDLPDEKIATMLDWDKPLSQQAPQVQAALKGIENDLPSIPDFDLKKWMDADPLASTWHNVLARDLRVEPSKISELLQNKGIAGIKYLDEGSRATTGKQTSNFVVFPNEEKSMTILERNGIPASQIENPAYTDPFGNTIGSSIR